MIRFWLMMVAGLAAVECGGRAPLASAKTVGQMALEFPTRTPRWLVTATEQSARGLDDPDATLTDLRLGRFPVVVIHGAFRCESCPRPMSSGVPTGHYASLTFDAVTHRLHDLALSTHRPGNLTSLCPGDCPGRRKIAVASAQQALDAAEVAVLLGDRRGRHRCLLSAHTTQSGFIAATCALTIAFGKQRTKVTFTEAWTGLDPSGRRYAADSPVLGHAWRIIETPDGWVTKLSSTGDPPPR